MGGAAPASTRGGWRGLMFALAAALLFLLVLGPLVARTPALMPMAAFIEDRGIETGAYTYTEVEAFAVAERHMRERLAPGRDAVR